MIFYDNNCTLLQNISVAHYDGHCHNQNTEYSLKFLLFYLFSSQNSTIAIGNK